MNETSKEETEVSEEPRLTMGKGERLRHRTLVERLFASGSSLYEYPLRLTWRIVSEDEMRYSFRSELPSRLGHLQMMVTIPKKKIRHAVDRVLMRRRIREAYRVNRIPLLHTVLSQPGIYLELAFIYLHKENTDYTKIEKKMRHLLAQMEKVVNNTATSTHGKTGECN